MPLPSRRPNPPRRPSRHTLAPARGRSSSPGSFTQTGAAGVTGTPKAQGFTPTPAARPLSPGTPAGSVLPPDPLYDAEAGTGGTIDRATGITVSGLTGERDRTLLDYGYTVQYDAEGNPLGDTLAFDPTNVFSRAAQLRKRWMESRVGTQNSMAAQGQMNSGAYGRAQRQVNYGESAATDAEIRGLTAFLARNGTQIAGAKISGETAKGEAEGRRLDRAATNPLYDPSRPAGAPGGAGPAGYNARAYRTQVVPGKGEWHVYPNGRRVFVRYQ